MSYPEMTFTVFIKIYPITVGLIIGLFLFVGNVSLCLHYDLMIDLINYPIGIQNRMDVNIVIR